jgi:hypothetical protein
MICRPKAGAGSFASLRSPTEKARIVIEHVEHKPPVAARCEAQVVFKSRLQGGREQLVVVIQGGRDSSAKS